MKAFKVLLATDDHKLVSPLANNGDSILYHKRGAVLPNGGSNPFMFIFTDFKEACVFAITQVLPKRFYRVFEVDAQNMADISHVGFLPPTTKVCASLKLVADKTPAHFLKH